MEYFSTRNNHISLNFENIFLKGLSDEGGLFLPKKIKKFSNNELISLKELSYEDLATEIISIFTGNFSMLPEIKHRFHVSNTSISFRVRRFHEESFSAVPPRKTTR